jgi:hypothetical protein
VQPIAILQPHPAQHKTPKNREKRPQTKQKKEKTSPEGLFFSFISSVFPPAPLAFRSRAQRRTNNNDETPEEKTGFVTKIQKRGGFRFSNFLEMGITEMRRTRNRLIHRCRSAYENTKKWDQNTHHKDRERREDTTNAAAAEDEDEKKKKKKQGEEQAQAERVSRKCSYRGYYLPKVNHNQLTVPRMGTVLFTPQGR